MAVGIPVELLADVRLMNDGKTKARYRQREGCSEIRKYPRIVR